MKELYKLGEIAKLLGISDQTLRNYSNYGMIKPEQISKSGYRYYSFEQIHLIDKIRYLRELGIPLPDIKIALESSDTDSLQHLLEEQKRRLLKQRDEIDDALSTLEWYIDYFKYAEEMSIYDDAYIMQFPERTALVVDYTSKNGKSDVSETLLTNIRYSKEGKKLKYLRQYGYLIDPSALKKNKCIKLRQFMFVKELKPDLEDTLTEHIIHIPAGKYLCFFSDKEMSRPTPQNAIKKLGADSVVIATEFENALGEYGEKLRLEFEIYLG